MSAAPEYSVRVPLRWRDIDLLGHLNQSVYHELLEEARVAFMSDLVRRAGDDRAYGSFVLAHVDLDHHSEVRKDDEAVDVAVALDRVGTASIRLRHEIRLPDGRVAASGTTVLVAWDPVARSKRVLSEGELAALR